MAVDKTVCDRFIEAVTLLIGEQKVKTQEDFSSQIGISQNTFSAIKKYRQNVTLKILKKTASKFDVDSSYILTGKRQQVNVVADREITYESKVKDEMTDLFQLALKNQANILNIQEQMAKLMEYIASNKPEKERQLV